MSSIRYEFIMSQVKWIRDIKESEKVKISLVFYEGCQTTCILKVCKDRDLTEIYQALMKLRHPNLAIVYDCVYENGNTYVVEEYIQGKTLAELLAEQGNFSEEDTVHIMKEVCEGLEVLHQQEPYIIHNDIKTANIMLREDGGVKLFDFDISRIYKEGSYKNTRLMGTHEYAAPEHYGFGQSEPCTDIYSLGVTMHEMLTGTGLDHEHCVTYEGRLADVIRKCVEIDRKKRYPTAALLKSDIEKALKKTISLRNIVLGVVWGTILLTMGSVFINAAMENRKDFQGDIVTEDTSVMEAVTELETQVETEQTEEVVNSEVVEDVPVTIPDSSQEGYVPEEPVSETPADSESIPQTEMKIVHSIEDEFLAMEAWNDGVFLHLESISGSYYLRSSDGKEKQLEGIRAAYGAQLECNPYMDQMYLIVFDYEKQYVYTVTKDFELELVSERNLSGSSNLDVAFLSDGTMVYDFLIIKDKKYTFESLSIGENVEFLFKERDEIGNTVNIYPLKDAGIKFLDYQNTRAVYNNSEAVYFIGVKDGKNYLYCFDGQKFLERKCFNDDPAFIPFGYEELCVSDTLIRCYGYPYDGIVEFTIE